MPTLTIITPTVGRPSLATMLIALAPQLEEGDECLVLGDGPQPTAEQIVAAVVSVSRAPVQYIEHPLAQNWGNPQRNTAIHMAKGELLVFIDDDDCPLPDGLSTIKRVAAEHPKRPLMFSMLHQGLRLPQTRTIVPGNISGQMFIAPNVPGRLGTWSDRYAADFDFIEGTMRHYAPEDLVWRDEITAAQGFHGPG